MRKTVMSMVIVLVLAAAVAAEAPGKGGQRKVKGSKEPRLASIVEANIKAVHAFQVLLFRQAGKGERKCWESALSDEELQKLVELQKAVLAADIDDVRAWVEGNASSSDSGASIADSLSAILSAPLEPPDCMAVNIFTQYLSENTKASSLEARSIASLYQTVMEVNRDGDLLQDQFKLYVALGLPVYVGQLGLPGGDGDFLTVGEKLSPKTCSSPYETDAAAWQIAGRKIWNWGQKNTGARNATVLASEILAEDDIAALIPSIRSAPAQRIAIIGHSFTIDLHWASPSAFAPIVKKVFEMENPAVEMRQWYGGGLTASRALKKYYDEALAWKPDKVLFVVGLRRDEDDEALKQMCEGFAAAGVKVYAFDTIRAPAEGREQITFGEERAKEFDIEVIEVGAVLARSPEKDKFVCLDTIHMTEPYHRLMAKEWLKFLVGARGLKLAE